jgi:hypothetical protein
MLSEIEISDDTYRVSIDTAATYLATGSPFVVGYKSAEVKDGFWIEFISDNGTVIKNDEKLSSSMDIPEKAVYVRAKVTYSRPRGSNSEQFFAWTQPVFLSSN